MEWPLHQRTIRIHTLHKHYTHREQQQKCRTQKNKIKQRFPLSWTNMQCASSIIPKTISLMTTHKKIYPKLIKKKKHRKKSAVRSALQCTTPPLTIVITVMLHHSPFVRWKPGHNEQHDAHTNVAEQHAHLQLDRETERTVNISTAYRVYSNNNNNWAQHHSESSTHISHINNVLQTQTKCNNEKRPRRWVSAKPNGPCRLARDRARYTSAKRI